MPIPHAAHATIAAEKLTAYLLNPSHKRGGAKAKRLLSLGYRTTAPEILEADLRTQHLSLDPERISQNAYGVVYEIDGSIKTPSGKMARFVSIWPNRYWKRRAPIYYHVPEVTEWPSSCSAT